MTTRDPKRVHAAVLEAVENQLQQNDPPEVGETYARLLASGHSEDEAKRLLAIVLASEIFDISKTQTGYDQARYVKRLRRLPELPWEYEEEAPS